MFLEPDEFLHAGAGPSLRGRAAPSLVILSIAFEAIIAAGGALPIPKNPQVDAANPVA